LVTTLTTFMRDLFHFKVKFVFVIFSALVFAGIVYLLFQYFGNLNTAWFLGSIAFIIFGIPIILMLYYFNLDFFRIYWLELKHWTGQEVLKEEHRSILGKYFTYYSSLPRESRPRFEKKLAKFMASKRFVFEKDNSSQAEMKKVLVSASAVQLTFGLGGLSFPRFKRIVIYNSVYESPYTQRMHKGEASSKGSILLSWEHFLEGYTHKNDALNLGLHEMAHALRIENRTPSDGEYLFIHDHLWRTWDQHAIPVYHAVQQGNHSFLRNYAGTNSEEFFAVCVESFFEKPHEFIKELPDLYMSLAKILNQNPAKGIFRGY